MIDWVVNMPWALLMIVTVGSFAAFGLVGLSLTRRFLLPRLGTFSHRNEVMATVLHGILIIYGLAVALLAIAVWEKYSEATKIVASEAASIAALYRDLGAYPEPLRARLRGGLKSYTEYVIHEAWPLQRRGKTPAGGVALLDQFQNDLVAFEPATLGQLAYHQETLRAYNTLVLFRRQRLELITIALPAPMWTLILFGAMITLASAFFFDVGSGGRLDKLMIVLLSAITGLLIFMIVYYDQPLRGSHSVPPDAYELIYEHLMKD